MRQELSAFLAALMNAGDGSVLMFLPQVFPDPETELETLLVETGAALLMAEGMLADTALKGHGKYGEAFAAAFKTGEPPPNRA